MENVTFIEGLGIAVLGMLVVFVVLIVLMGAIEIQNIVIAKLENRGKTETPAPTTLPEAPAPAATPAKLAKGSCGGVMLHDVPDATAAMIMAIVADELKTPLNELRFISIQEVK